MLSTFNQLYPRTFEVLYKGERVCLLAGLIEPHFFRFEINKFEGLQNFLKLNLEGYYYTSFEAARKDIEKALSRYEALVNHPKKLIRADHEIDDKYVCFYKEEKICDLIHKDKETWRICHFDQPIGWYSLQQFLIGCFMGSMNKEFKTKESALSALRNAMSVWEKRYKKELAW